MSTTYPTTKQSIPNPSSTDLLENTDATLDHDYQHSTINDTIEALQDKVGIDGSAVTTSHDYKLSAVTGSEKALTSGVSTQSVEDLTLVTPVLSLGSDATGDMYYRNSGGALTRLPAGTDGQIISYSSGIPTTIANPAAADASTTVKGVSEEATQAEVLARTTAGATSARLFVNPSTLTTVQTYDYAVSSGGTDTYAITVSPAPTAYVAGQVFRFKADVVNTGACTLNVNSLGAKTIKKNVSSDLIDGDILADQLVEVIYDGTNMQLVSRSGGSDVKYTVNANIDITDYFTTTTAIADTNFGWSMSTSNASVTNTKRPDGNNIQVSTTGANAASYSGSTTLRSTTEVRVKFWAKQTTTDGRETLILGFTNNYIEIETGSTAVKAVSNSGGGPTTTTLSGITSTNLNVYQIVYTTTAVSFYVNGVLLATHITNIGSTVSGLKYQQTLAYVSGGGGTTTFDFGQMIVSNKIS